MANRIRNMFVWILCIGSAFDVVLGARKELRLVLESVSMEAAPALSSVVESTRKLRVEIFGYPCEEDTVFPP